MPESAPARRLAAILYTDVVGYSRLMGADEAGTHARLKTLRETIFKPQIVAYNGRIIRLMGDGSLVEFPSIVDAFACAVEVQRAVANHNAEVAEDQRIVFRIGINLGDIIVDDDDIHGDGVNIAARLEPLAEPGGICVSQFALDAVGNKLALDYEDMGAQSVKNISKPVRAYRVKVSADAVMPQAGGGAVKPPKRIVESTHSWIAIAVLVVSVLLIAAWGWWSPDWRALLDGNSVTGRSAAADKPSIAVLPFDNMSQDKAQDYFTNGIVEDIVTDLSKVSGLHVTSRSATLRYKGNAGDLHGEPGTERPGRIVLVADDEVQGHGASPAARRKHRGVGKALQVNCPDGMDKPGKQAVEFTFCFPPAQAPADPPVRRSSSIRQSRP